MRRTNFITALLVIMVIALVGGLALSVYYVFFSDGSGFLKFGNKKTGEVQTIEAGRKYIRRISGKEYTAEIYPNGTMGLGIYTEGSVAGRMQNTLTLTGSVDKIEMKDVDIAYEVKAGTEEEYTVVVIKTDGTVWYLDLDILYNTGTVSFKQIGILRNITRIFETGVITDNEKYSNSNNVVAVDASGNEYVITDKIMSTDDTEITNGGY